MPVGCGRTPEYSEETPACTERTSKLHTDKHQLADRFQPRTFFSEATVQTSAPVRRLIPSYPVEKSFHVFVF